MGRFVDHYYPTTLQTLLAFSYFVENYTTPIKILIKVAPSRKYVNVFLKY